MEAENQNAHPVAVSGEDLPPATLKVTVTGATAGQLATPEEHFEARLESAARGLCKARNIDPNSLQGYDNGTMAYTMRPAWQNAAAELRQQWLIAQFVRTLP